MAQRRKKEYHSVKKRKISLVKETCNVGAPRWRPYFEQTLPYIMLKTLILYVAIKCFKKILYFTIEASK